MESDYSDVTSPGLDLADITQTHGPGSARGTGRKRGRPKGSGTGRGRASKASSPSQSPKPVNNKIKLTFTDFCLLFAELSNSSLMLLMLLNTPSHITLSLIKLIRIIISLYVLMNLLQILTVHHRTVQKGHLHFTY